MNLINKTSEELQHIINEAKEYLDRTTKIKVSFPSSLTKDQIESVIENETGGNVVESSIVMVECGDSILLECESRKVYMGE